jgi:hypothetical protein
LPAKNTAAQPPKHSSNSIPITGSVPLFNFHACGRDPEYAPGAWVVTSAGREAGRGEEIEREVRRERKIERKRNIYICIYI